MHMHVTDAGVSDLVSRRRALLIARRALLVALLVARACLCIACSS